MQLFTDLACLAQCVNLLYNLLPAVLVSLVYIMYRKSPYTAFGNSMQGPSALFHGTMGTPPPGSGPSPHQTSGPLSDGRQSLDATRRARSESASQYTSVRCPSSHLAIPVYDRQSEDAALWCMSTRTALCSQLMILYRYPNLSCPAYLKSFALFLT